MSLREIAGFKGLLPTPDEDTFCSFVNLNFYISRCFRDSTSTALSGNRADRRKGFQLTGKTFAFTKL